MTNEITSFDPSTDGLFDLDELVTAQKLIDTLSKIHLTRQFRLDLRQCYLDYGPCSLVMEHLVKIMGSIDGAKCIEIDTVVELGKPSHYRMLFFRGAPTITKGESNIEKLQKNVLEHLRSMRCVVLVRVFAPDAEAIAEPLHTINLSDDP